MGSSLSTRWNGHIRRRMVGEGLLVLDVPTVRELQTREGATLRAGPLELRGGLLPLEAVPTPFNGTRYWLRCASCKSRRKALYSMPPRAPADGSAVCYMWWRCRVCLHLGYVSQRLDRLSRIHLRGETIARRLGASEWDVDAWAPPRPRGMHVQTYQRHRTALEELALAYSETWSGMIDQFLARHPEKPGTGVAVSANVKRRRRAG